MSWCRGFCPQWSESQTVRPPPSKSSVVMCFQDVLRRRGKRSQSTCASMCSPDLFGTCVWYKPCFYQWGLYHFQPMIQFFIFLNKKVSYLVLIGFVIKIIKFDFQWTFTLWVHVLYYCSNTWHDRYPVNLICLNPSALFNCILRILLQ